MSITDIDKTSLPLVLLLDEDGFRRVIREEMSAALSARCVENVASSEEGERSKSRKEWLTNKEAGQYLGVSKATMQRYRDRGLLEYSKVGSKIYFRLSAIDKFLSDQAMMSLPAEREVKG